MVELNDALVDLFRAHGVDAVSREDKVYFPGRIGWAQAVVVDDGTPRDPRTARIDVRLEIGRGRVIVESFAGMGETPDSAVADAVRGFASNTFHVLLAAFFGDENEQVSREEWTFGGRSGRVVLGTVGFRGEASALENLSHEFFDAFRQAVQRRPLRPGTHWARLYYGQMRGEPLAVEVLLDNGVWTDVQAEMAAFSWQAMEAFYSVRLFLTIDVESAVPAGPEEAVAWVAEVVGPWEEFTEDEVLAALAGIGFEGPVAVRAFQLTQVAWGRALLDGIGTRFSPNYLCFDANGEVVESGLLADEPHFRAATALVERYKGWPGFARMALMSADVNAVNGALHAGSKPTDLVMGPAGMFLEPPTAAGAERANEALAAGAKAAAGPSDAARPPTAKKPRWRFW